MSDILQGNQRQSMYIQPVLGYSLHTQGASAYRLPGRQEYTQPHVHNQQCSNAPLLMYMSITSSIDSGTIRVMVLSFARISKHARSSPGPIRPPADAKAAPDNVDLVGLLLECGKPACNELDILPRPVLRPNVPPVDRPWSCFEQLHCTCGHCSEGN